MENSVIEGCGALIYCKSTHRYLFLLRNSNKFKHSWGLAGGKVNKGESVIQALHREILEELGGVINDAKVRPIEKFTSTSAAFIYHTYHIVVDLEFVPELNHEHCGYCWVPLDHYPRPLHPGVWRTFKFTDVVNKIKTLEQVI